MKPEQFPTAHQLAKKLLEGPDWTVILPRPLFDTPGAWMALPVDVCQHKIGERDVILLTLMKETKPEEKDPQVGCDNCQWTGPASAALPLENAPGLGERLDPGAEVPAGECPECKAFCYLIK
jgi:hypothetical protein